MTKVNAIDIKVPSTSVLVSKTQYNSEKQNLQKKIEDVDKKITNTKVLIKKIDYNTNLKTKKKKDLR